MEKTEKQGTKWRFLPLRLAEDRRTTDVPRLCRWWQMSMRLGPGSTAMKWVDPVRRWSVIFKEEKNVLVDNMIIASFIGHSGAADGGGRSRNDFSGWIIQ